MVARVDRHLECVDGEVAAQRRGHLPTNDGSAEDVNDERHVGPPTVALHVGEVRDPETIRCTGDELAIDEVTRTVQLVIAEGRFLEPATTPGALQFQIFHEPLDGAARDRVALALQLFPDLDDAVNGEVVVVHASDLRLKFLVANPARAGGPRLGGVIGRGSKLQSPADGSTPHRLLRASM